ncbi:hypothetical protein QBC39DRAFT_376936 [Podospora conica]|nr:hypothetical protein QBC39DRAFT_376936 [Schizothecium conicum]
MDVPVIFGETCEPITRALSGSKGGSETITFDNAIIATGPHVRLLLAHIMDRDLPKKMVIVEAGAIGMELGHVLRNYGVDVTMIEFLDRAMPNVK